MLVLSRHTNQVVVFPSLGITVRVVRVQGDTVRLGIEAPPDVKVLRGELLGGEAVAAAPSAGHVLRNRLNKVTLALDLLGRQLDAGRLGEARQTLDKAVAASGELERGFAPANRLPGPRRRTLVVEDDHNERELLAGLLSLQGYACDVAEDGIAALEYLTTRDRPDVVLLDMRMPRCDGPKTLAHIRADPRLAGLTVFGISGCSPREVGITTGPGGVDAWFPKPLDTRQLAEAMRQALPADGAN